MSSPDNLSPATINNAPPPQSVKDNIQTVSKRLAEADLGEFRFNPLQSGKKEPISHTVYKPGAISGNYGVYAGDGLVLIDIDDYKSDVQRPAELADLPITFTAQSPHGGEHRYYSVENQVQNKQLPWGEIRAENQYVVGPGSELASCTKDNHDCSAPGNGHYQILRDQPIATVDRDELFQLSPSTDDASKDRDTRHTLDATETTAHSEAVEFNVERRLEKMKRCTYGNKVKALWKGRYRAAGFNDRSRAEASLVAYLGWWMQGNRKIVKQLMDRACKEHPQADVNGLRKWREAGALYQNLTLDFVKHDSYYEPPQRSRPFDERPATSHVTRKNFYNALLDLGIARMVEITEHESFDRSVSAARRARNWYEEQGIVKRINDHPYTYYYLDGLESLIDEEMRKQLGI
ncbi:MULTISPECIES: bifunctional DNA primase/polymerase [Halorussus]|uniref:bifunctional DNA primase/polymerase n=1 Tax=Halorussus TaxID=1070314 RepID=UPI0020A1CCB2|nr:bifunctional DNA primase/polymerase [Halorussus vallis]USZ77218.1 bifunctional DNA primase/polymerase [Halorussus vallis]